MHRLDFAISSDLSIPFRVRATEPFLSVQVLFYPSWLLQSAHENSSGAWHETAAPPLSLSVLSFG